MANHSISMLLLRRLLQQKKQGLSNRKIANNLQISRDTVNIYVQRISGGGRSLEELLSLTDEHLASYLMAPAVPEKRDKRYEQLMPLLPAMIKELAQPHMTRRVLWEAYRKDNPDGYAYSQFCSIMERYIERTNAVMHLEHKPGEELYFDFAGDKLCYFDPATGGAISCPVFIAVLPFSSYNYVEALPNQKRDQLLAAMNRMLRYFGGVPQSVTSDNMKQYVTKVNRYEPAISELVLQWSCHFDTTLLATREASPGDKAAVESAVQSAYHRIYPYLRNIKPRSISELNDCIRYVLQTFNAAPMQKKDHSRLEAFEHFERTHLKKLPIGDFVPKTTVTAKIAPDYHAWLGEDRHRYSVPFQFIGYQVNIVYDTDHVEVYWKHERIAMHRRSYVRGGYTTIDSHMPPDHLGYKESRVWDAEHFINTAERIGPATSQVIQRLLKQKTYKEQTYRSCMGILKLGTHYTPMRLEAACRRVGNASKISYSLINSILQKRLDESPEHQITFQLPVHENIRGPQAYSHS